MPTREEFQLTTDGELICHLASANVEPLLNSGWLYPEPFKVKARDGETDIYGVIYYPSHLTPRIKKILLFLSQNEADETALDTFFSGIINATSLGTK